MNRETDGARTATCLLAQAPEILRRWDARVRREIPASQHQQPLVLQNNLAPFLCEVAKALCPTGEPEFKIDGLTLAQDHGGHRARLPEYSIDEMFLEYRLLRQTVLEVLDEEHALAPDDRETINDALERAMQDAVGQFARVHQEEERRRAEEAQRTAEELRVAYDRERRIAEFLQRPLLNPVAEDAAPGLLLATLYEPARREAEVGGDFFDVIELPEGRVGLVVGDTCGKGLEAAVHNTHVKDVLRAFLREDPQNPGEVLSLLNRDVCSTLARLASGDDTRFVVLALAVVDPASGAVLYASAGAEPALLLRPNGTWEELCRPALPLGIDADRHYEHSALQLESGDTLLMLTDGITEARQGNDFLGLAGAARLAQAALEAPSLSEAGQRVLDGAREYARGVLKDDACLILARRL